MIVTKDDDFRQRSILRGIQQPISQMFLLRRTTGLFFLAAFLGIAAAQEPGSLVVVRVVVLHRRIGGIPIEVEPSAIGVGDGLIVKRFTILDRHAIGARVASIPVGAQAAVARTAVSAGDNDDRLGAEPPRQLFLFVRV